MIDFQAVVGHQPDFVSEQLDHAIVMMDVRTGDCYGLEAVARRIWELLEHPVSVETLCQSLQKEYTVDSAICRLEVLAFINDLNREGLIRVIA